MPGLLAFRSETLGSHYIHHLCAILKSISTPTNFLSILERLNCEMSTDEFECQKQCPEYTSTLRKTLIFKPNNVCAENK